MSFFFFMPNFAYFVFKIAKIKEKLRFKSMKKVICDSVWKFIPIIVSFLAMFYLLAGSEARKPTKTVFILIYRYYKQYFHMQPSREVLDLWLHASMTEKLLTGTLSLNTNTNIFSPVLMLYLHVQGRLSRHFKIKIQKIFETLLYPRLLCRRVYSFRFSVCQFVCSFVHSFVCLFVRLIVRSFVRSLVR